VGYVIFLNFLELNKSFGEKIEQQLQLSNSSKKIEIIAINQNNIANKMNGNLNHKKGNIIILF